jgi:geranylgeranyl reductase family protein
MREYDVVIVGAGPSGCATAIELANRDQTLAPRVLLLDKAVFPRIKLCAGGLTADADLILRELDVCIDLPAVPVHLTKFLLPTGQLLFEQPDHFRVIRRDQFDELLFRTASERGVVTRDGEEVDAIIRIANEVIVKTSREEYRTQILVGADGANSTTRKAVGLQRSDRLMVAMESIATLRKSDLPRFTDNMAIFDVSLTSRGVPGYCWIFPTAYEKSRAASLGIMAAPSRKSEIVPVKAIFTKWVEDHGINMQDFEPKAHPILRYEPRAPASTNRVVLTGDAAGIDPLFGEGIFSALALGRITAKSVADALESRNFSFSDYEKRIRSSSIGSVMRRRRLLANRLYASPRLSQQLLHYGPLLKWIAFLRLQKGKMSWQPYKQ